MKKVLLFLSLAACLAGCTNNSSVETETRSDTITNVTNPGLGAVSDDTAIMDK